MKWMERMQAELDRMAQTGRVKLTPALANLTPTGCMTARCLEGGRLQLEFDSPMQSPRRWPSPLLQCLQHLQESQTPHIASYL